MRACSIRRTFQSAAEATILTNTLRFPTKSSLRPTRFQPLRLSYRPQRMRESSSNHMSRINTKENGAFNKKGRSGCWSMVSSSALAVAGDDPDRSKDELVQAVLAGDSNGSCCLRGRQLHKRPCLSVHNLRA